MKLTLYPQRSRGLGRVKIEVSARTARALNGVERKPLGRLLDADKRLANLYRGKKHV